MSICEQRGFDNICALLEKGGAKEEGYTTRCPHPEVHGHQCGLVIGLEHWTEDALKRSAPGRNVSQADRIRAQEEVLPEVVLVFCEHEV